MIGKWYKELGVKEQFQYAETSEIDDSNLCKVERIVHVTV